MKYYFEQLIVKNGKPVYTGKTIEIEDRKLYDEICGFERKILKKGEFNSWFKPFILHENGDREYFKLKTKTKLMGKNITDAQKMENLIEALGTNKNYLAKSLGYKSHRTVYAIVDGTNNLSEGMIHRIIQHYPNVNYNYLKKGELPILLDETKMRAQQNILNLAKPNNELDTLKRLLDVPGQLDRIERKLDKLLGDK